MMLKIFIKLCQKTLNWLNIWFQISNNFFGDKWLLKQRKENSLNENRGKK